MRAAAGRPTDCIAAVLSQNAKIGKDHQPHGRVIAVTRVNNELRFEEPQKQGPAATTATVHPSRELTLAASRAQETKQMYLAHVSSSVVDSYEEADIESTFRERLRKLVRSDLSQRRVVMRIISGARSDRIRYS